MKTALRFIHGFIFFALLLATIPSFEIKAQQYVKSDFRVSDITGFSYQAVQLSVSNSGDMAVAWETSGNGDIWLKTISSKGEVLSDLIAVDDPFSSMETRVAHNDLGNIMVIYGANNTGWIVMGQSYSPAGDPLGDTVLVSRNTAEQIDMFRSSLRASNTNQFGAFLPGLDSMIVELFSESGEFLNHSVVLKPDAAYFQQLHGQMTYKGDLVLLWLNTSDGNFWGRIYSADGTPSGDAFQVSQKDPTNYLTDASLCSDTAGNFAVVWTSTFGGDADLYTQVFSKGGVPIGGNTKVTDDQAVYYQSYIRSIDMDLDGNFVVAWTDYRASDTSFIYMQQMDKQGAPVGANYRATTINNSGPDQQFTYLPTQVHPSVRILRDTIYLAWMNINENESITQDVYANIQEWKKPDVTGLGQGKESRGTFYVYPNPSQGTVFLRWDAPYAGQAVMTLYNSSGMLMHQETIVLSGRELEIDLPDMQEGIYYMKLEGGSLHSSVPLIITPDTE